MSAADGEYVIEGFEEGKLVRLRHKDNPSLPAVYVHIRGLVRVQSDVRAGAVVSVRNGGVVPSQTEATPCQPRDS